MQTLQDLLSIDLADGAKCCLQVVRAEANGAAEVGHEKYIACLEENIPH